MTRQQKQKKIPFFDILLGTLTIVLIIAAVTLLYFFKQKDTASNEPIVINLEDVTSVEEVQASELNGIQVITETSEHEEVPFKLQYPKSEHESFNDKIATYIKELKENYLDEINTSLNTNIEFTRELNTTLELSQHPNGTYSFILSTAEQVGEFEQEIYLKTFHLDNETGEQFDIQAVLDNQDENLTKFAKLAQKTLFEDKMYKETLSGETIYMLTEPVWDNFNEFSFTDEEMIIYFTEYSTSEDSPIIKFPYDDVNELFSETFKLASNDTPEDVEDPSDSDSSPTVKRVALTFDDGPAPQTTERILKTLEKYDAKATFFMLGSQVEAHPEIAKLVQEAGHELGNHSWSHSDLSRASDENITNEIHNTSKIIEDVTGEKPYSFRPPYGALNDAVRMITDIPIALWDVDTLDWKHRNPQQMLHYVKQQTGLESIILMHDIHPSTADGLDAVMAYLVENGYEFVTVSEIIPSK